MSEAPERIWACVSKNTKSGVVTLLGDATFAVDGWQEYIRADRIEAQAAEIERLRGDLAKAQGALHKIAGKKDYADDPWDIARAALAEIKGESHE